MSTYYVPSGKFSASAFMFWAIFGAIWFPLGGFLYALGIIYIPFIYILFLLTGIFGVTIGLVMQFAMMLGKVRNPLLGLGLGIVGGLIALYIHWAVWLTSVGGQELSLAVELGLNPMFMFDVISEVNQTGTWGVSSGAVSGIFLTIVWVIEALVIVGAAAYFPYSQACTPFSERANDWFKEKTLPILSYIEDKASFVSKLEQGRSDVFDSLTYLSEGNQNHSVFTLYEIEKDDCYISVVNKVMKVEKDGDVDFDEEDVVEHISISVTMKDKLLTGLEKA